MPSRTRAQARGLAERLLRGGAVVALALTLVRLVMFAGAEPAVHHERLTAAPSARERDSLAAMARAGERVTWSGSVAAIAAMAESVREPRPAVRVSVVADSFAIVADTLGVLDSLPSGGGTLTVATGGELAEGAQNELGMRVTERGSMARVSAAPADEPGRILVLGRAGWESKFVVAALEEAGWRVDARLLLSDTMRVAQGSPAPPTLATHAVVVVLDSSGWAESAAITRFVRAGGGLLLAGDAIRGRVLAAIAPARAGGLLAPESRTFDDVDPLHALPVVSLTSPRSDAVALESRDGALAIAARREGQGRVVQSGFVETWRWRMEGGLGSVAAHRDWWSRLVALAVPTPDIATTSAAADEGAPLAALTAALGAAAEPPARSGPRSPPLPIGLGAAILVALLAEWALRRTRGAA